MKMILVIGIMFNILNTIMSGFEGNWHSIIGWFCATLFSISCLLILKDIEIDNLKKD